MPSCNLIEELGARLKAARAALGWTQKELCAAIDMPLPSLRDYELGKTIPGSIAVCAYAHAGINANWLLTGEGPMLLADLETIVVQEVEKEVVRQVAPPINKAALGMILGGILKAMGNNVDHVKAAQKAVEYYQDAINEGLITPTGIGEGGSKAA